MQVGESGENSFDVLVDSFGGLILFVGAELGVAVLDILADQDEGSKKKLGNVGEKEQESEGIWINGPLGNELPGDPERNYQENGVDGVHGADDPGGDGGYLVMGFEERMVLEINVFRSAAGFEVT